MEQPALTTGHQPLLVLGTVLCCLALLTGWGKGVALAENILLMPSANQVRAGEQEFNLSLVNLAEPGSGDLSLYEAYYGLSDSLEVSLTKVKQTGAASEKSFNVSFFVTPETPHDWATVIGASNVGGDQYLGSNDPSYYIAFYRTRAESKRPQKGRAPGYRYHLGYGTNVHDGFFGGVQITMSPRMWMGAFNYTGQPIYLADYTVLDSQRGRLSLRAGYLFGDPWIGVSYGLAGG